MQGNTKALIGSLAIAAGLLAATFTGCTTPSSLGEFTPASAQYRFALAQQYSVPNNGIEAAPRVACTWLQRSLETMVGGKMTFKEAGISEKKFQMLKELNGCKFN